MKRESERQDLMVHKEAALLKMGKWLTLQEMQGLAAKVWEKLLTLSQESDNPSKKLLMEYQDYLALGICIALLGQRKGLMADMHIDTLEVKPKEKKIVYYPYGEKGTG